MSAVSGSAVEYVGSRPSIDRIDMMLRVSQIREVLHVEHDNYWNAGFGGNLKMIWMRGRFEWRAIY